MKKILCPTDFSETANQAIAFASMIAKKAKAELTLFNVQSIFALHDTEVIPAIETIREQLEQQKNQVIKLFNIACRAEILPSDKNLTDIISRHAKGFDLIVMGTNGADDNYELFFGSQSYQIAKEVSVPVMLIPTGCAYKDIYTIGFALEYELGQELPMKQLATLASLLEAKVTVLQVKSTYKREEELNEEQIQTRTKMLYNLMDLEFDTIFSDEVSDSINGYIEKNNINVLAVCSIHYNFIKTIFHNSIIKA
ncbi:MAG: universal stress protein, partial [Bacteroidia bacterium]|nr:universal stress protein [Bacteroidia bacterium]